MAKVIGTISGEIKETIKGVILDTPVGATLDDWTITYLFEAAIYDVEDKQRGNREQRRSVLLRLGSIKDDRFDVDGLQGTVAQLAAALLERGEFYRDVDDARTEEERVEYARIMQQQADDLEVAAERANVRARAQVDK